jgi:hypothetical protein
VSKKAKHRRSRNPIEEAALYAINPGRKRRRRSKRKHNPRHRRRGRKSNPSRILGSLGGLVGRLKPTLGEIAIGIGIKAGQMGANFLVDRFFKEDMKKDPKVADSFGHKLAEIIGAYLGPRAVGMLFGFVPAALTKQLGPRIGEAAWPSATVRVIDRVVLPAIPGGKVKEFLSSIGLRGFVPQPARGAVVDGSTGVAYELDGMDCKYRGPMPSGHVDGMDDDEGDGIDGMDDDEGDGIDGHVQ